LVLLCDGMIWANGCDAPIKHGMYIMCEIVKGHWWAGGGIP